MSEAMVLLPWVFGFLSLVVLGYLVILMRKKMAESEQKKATEGTPKQISLKVPDNIKLEEMTTEEIEKLALDMARKAASGLPKDSTLLGIDSISLAKEDLNNKALGFGIIWKRSCDAGDLTREGIKVNPEVFRDPVRHDLLDSVSTKVRIETKAPEVTK